MSKIHLEPDQLASLIEEIMDDRPENLAPIEQGAWSAAFSFDLVGAGYVIRLSRYDEDFRKDRFAARFDSPGLPVPEIVHIGEAVGGWCAVSRKAPGVALERLDALQMRQAVPAVLALLDALRGADLSGTHGFGGWNAEGDGWAKSWKESLLAIDVDDPGSRIAGWRDKLVGSAIGTARFDGLYRQFASLVPACPEARHLIHADLLHDNLLVDRGKISAVLDWGCARYGDFLYELAWFTFWSPWTEAMAGIDWSKLAKEYYEAHSVPLPDFDQRLVAYQLHIGLDSVAYCSFIEDWEMVEKVLRQMEGIVAGLV